MWSFGNEMQVQEPWCGYPTGDWGVTTYRMMDVLAKRYDKTRPSTAAMFPARAGAMTKEDPDFNIKVSPPELSTVTDIASYNYRYPAFPTYAKEFPHLIFYQSEAATDAMGQAYYGMDLNKVVGLAYWGAIEYWGESHGWPRKGWNYSYFDHSLEPFPQAYFIKSLFSDEPLVHIGVVDAENESIEWNDVKVGRTPMSSHWNRTPGSLLNIVTYTNAEEVELFVNGRSQGVQRNTAEPATRNAIYWNAVPYAAGNVVAVARTGGKEVARHRLETTGRAVALKIETENADWRADGMDLQYVKVRAVDSKGRVVPGATGEVTFDISGAARLIAVDNGDHISDELFAGTKRLLHKGKALAILRSDRTPGKVTIRASVPGLKSARLTLTTQ
jgi:beta-galactosidase